MFAYNDMKGSKTQVRKPNVMLWDGASDAAKSGWSRGRVLAEAQNFARWLMETPSNHMTPTAFVHAVTGKLGEVDGETKKKIEFFPR